MDWRVIVGARAKLRWCAAIAEEASTVAHSTCIVPGLESVPTVVAGDIGAKALLTINTREN